MKRVFIVLTLCLIAEYFAFQMHTNHPLIRPPYFHTLLLCIQMGMCWAGVESARWLLRRSPIAGDEGVQSDWSRLWLWVGPPGGLLLTLACFLGSWVASLSDSRLAGPLVVAHICGGALAWLVAGFWTLPEALSDPDITAKERMLAMAGIATHALGFLAYFIYYPATTVPFVALLGSALFFFFLLFYLGMTCLTWAVIFQIWPAAKSR